MKIATCICQFLTKIHAKGIAHGDVYAHNIKIGLVRDMNDKPDLTAILYDFGAASYFSGMSAWVYEKIQNVEVLAFGNFLEEMLKRTSNWYYQQDTITQAEIEKHVDGISLLKNLIRLQKRCQLTLARVSLVEAQITLQNLVEKYTNKEYASSYDI